MKVAREKFNVKVIKIILSPWIMASVTLEQEISISTNLTRTCLPGGLTADGGMRKKCPSSC